MVVNYHRRISRASLTFLIILLLYVTSATVSGVEIGCPASNINKIAMESLIIQASSSTEGHSPNQAFLSGGNCWLPTEDDNEPWLQADFAITMWLHVLETKGSSNSGQWVTNYIISYAESDGIFKNFTSGGAVKIFAGNNDGVTTKRHDLSPAIFVRFIRIHPKNWSSRPALKVKFYGCSRKCPVTPEALPFEDSQITASSEYSSYTARKGRLNDGSGWLGEPGSQSWLMVDFLQQSILSAVSVQGMPAFGCWSPSFTLEYSNDGRSFEIYQESGNTMQFTGISSASATKKFTLAYPIFARFLRFQAAVTSAVCPSTGSHHSALRIEVEGCHNNESTFYRRPLGMHDNSILDSQIRASSLMSYTSGPGNARLHLTAIPGVRDGGWIAADHDSKPWLQVDFIVNVTVSSLKMQGSADTSHRVTKYTLAYGDDGETFIDYKTSNQHAAKVFGVSLFQDFFPYIFTRFIRVYPKECNGSCAMRVEFYGDYEKCHNCEELGMENNKILDSQLSASAENTQDLVAPFGRLNNGKSWQGISLSNFELWYQVDFIKRAKIMGVKTQGYSSSYVTKFKISFSNNGINFPEYKDVMGTKEFTGQDEANTVVVHNLANVIVSRFLRLLPTEVNSEAGFRLEFIGCYVDTILHESIPLGMENGMILDAQLRASSEKFYHFSGAASGRFNWTTIPEVRSGGWIAADDDSEPWFQVDFISNATVTAIVTQGLDIGENYVKQYTVMFVDGEMGIVDYTDRINGLEMVFNASNGTVTQHLYPYIVTQIIRVKPKLCIGNCALRVEFYGWYEGNSGSEILGMFNRSKILDSQIRSSVKTEENRGSHTARLNASRGWLATDSGDYIQIDFGGRARIMQILSQGDSNEWTRNFTVEMSNDGVNFVDYKEYGARKTFFANVDGSSTVVQKPIHVIFARYLRIVVDWCAMSSDKCSLRLEFVGSIVDTSLNKEPVSLGMEDRSILGSQIFVSSTKDYRTSGADNARLYLTGISDARNSGWIAAEDDNSPWLLVDFITNVTISEISTQASKEGTSYVTTFALAFGNERDKLQNYKDEDYIDLILDANYDNSSIVRQPLLPVIVARFIQVRPMSWEGNCALRVEFYGFHEECTDPQPLGLENGTILDSQIAMSSVDTYSVGPQLARLNMVDGGARLDDDDADMYFEVDFLEWTKIIGLKTQGAADVYEVIQTFTLAYGADSRNIKHFEEYGQRKTFQGNTEIDTVVENRLSRVILTRLLRIMPVLWFTAPALRMEVIGSYVDTDWFQPFSLGIEDGSILDSQMAVSSHYPIAEAGNARLNLKTLHENGPSNSSIIRRYGGWVAAQEDKNPWFQIDFIANATISSIFTQGLENATSWITKFSVSFGYSKDMLQNYTVNGQVKVFSANFNHTSTVRNDFYPYIIARIFRIMPKEWIGYCALRVDVFGKYDCTNPQPLGLESGIILDSQLSSSSEHISTTGAQNARLNLLPLSSVRERGVKLDDRDTDRWIQVDFLKRTLVTGSKTQGFGTNEFLKEFNITYSSDGVNFRELKQYGNVKVYLANYDQDTIVEQRYPQVLFTRFIRFIPVSWESGVATRMEFLGSYVDTDWFDPVALGMESRLIVDSQLAVSTFKDSTSGPEQARLNLNATTRSISIISLNISAFNATMNITRNMTTLITSYVYHGGWIAAENDNDPWFQVDFRTNATVTALITQGLDSGIAWVTAYSLAYGHDRDDLQDYKVDGRIKVFSVNYNETTTVKQPLYPYIIARFLRIQPKTWIRYCALRVEFYGRYEGCTNIKPLGMENGTILNSQVSASSKNAWQSSAPLARLNLQPMSPLLSGWVPNTGDPSPWLQVDFLSYAKVTAILTQGDDSNFVRTFTVSYSNNNEDFQLYKEFGLVKVFRGNYEPTVVVVKQRLTRAIYARFIRLHPKTGNSGNMGIRTEFHGCYVEPDWFEPWPLGMESRLILDFQLSASSSKYPLSGPDKGRLNLNYTSNSTTLEIEKYGSWIAADDDSDPWLQVDFIVNVTISGIATQGEDEGEAWVTSYELSYGDSKTSLQNYQIDHQIKTFNANTDQNNTVKHDLQRVFIARYVRVKPKTWNNRCSMRVEFYGLFEGENISASLGMESGLILDGQITASSIYDWTHRAASGRLNVHPVSGNPWVGWRPDGGDMDKWFQVDFQTLAMVTSIFTQGLPGSENWVTVFTVAFGNDGKHFQDYIEFGKPKNFIGNFDKDTTVQQRLLHVIVARFIRLRHMESESAGSEGLRVDFNGSIVEYDCIDPIPLGLENNLIVNSQLKSSSEKDETTRALNARLRLKPIYGERVGAWVAAADDTNPWLKVDFKSNATVRGITTQGRFHEAEWVVTYEVSYSIHGLIFDTYEENGLVKVFSANFDSNSTVQQYLDPPIFATHIRLHPKECFGSCALRAEFHGCYEDCKNPIYLGLASNVIADSQFNSSSVGAEPAYQARLNKTSTSWVAATDDLYPWLEVNFLMRTKVQQIFSQGRDHEDKWVKSYSVSYSSDGKTFQYYTEYGRIKVFTGNNDRSSIVRHVLTRIIFTNRIRIHPKEFNTDPALRLEFAGCNFGCVFPNALGMEANYIEDYQISATSSWKYEHKPYYGRLHSHSSWIPDTEATHSLEVDFLHTTMLTGFIMQGGFMVDNFVTGFIISLGRGDGNFMPYQENGHEKVFLRNADANATVTYTLPIILVADSIKITVQSWNGTKPAMRVEFIGCYEDVDVCESSPCQNNGICNDHFTTYNFFNCTCPVGHTGRFCETECLDARPLGMSGGQIKDNQIDASSSMNDESVPPAARLNARAVRRSGGWVAAVNDDSQWFQVDFLVNTTVASILTQGRDQVLNWVETYQVSYSNDSENFRDYKQDGIIKIFDGNVDSDAVVDNILNPRLFTRVLRIHPKTCNLNCSLRAEFLGCYEVIPSRCLNPIPLGMENKEIKDHQINASSELYDVKYFDHYAAANGRMQATMYSRHSAWVVESSGAGTSLWFEVNFIYNTTVKEVMTQGRRNYNQWVKFYQIQYKNETSDLQDYKLRSGVEKIFKGNSDRSTIVNHTLSPVIRLQVIRILPLDCHDACALRAEFVGCYEDANVCDPSLCQNNATCNDHFDFFNFFNCSCVPGYTGALCETEIDECLSYPCLNGGTCNNEVNFYNCTCTINYHGTNCENEVIWPIANFTAPFISAHLFGTNISVVWEMDQGSYVTIEVFYNEMLCCNHSMNRHLNYVGSKCNCSITDPNLFDPDGVVDLRIYAYNEVSNVTKTLKVEVLKIIENIAISALTSFASWGIGVKGAGSQKNVYPAEYPVQLSATFDGGPASIVEWTFECSVSSAISDESELSFDKTFPSDIAQLCNIDVALTNNISTDTASTTIDLRESIIFTSFTYDGPLKPNQTMTFTLSFEKFGQGTCVVVDMGDNSSLLVFGDDSCEGKIDVSQINPNIVEEPRLTFSTRSPETSVITIEHQFPGVGSYPVKMSAKNLLANVTESLVAVVIPFVCKYPNVTITGLAPNNSNLLAAVQVYRSVSIFVSTENEIYCEKTNYVVVSWTIYKIEDDPAILTTTSRIKVSDLGKSVFHAGTISSDLFLPGRYLPFGFYEISARVEMKGLPDIFGIGTLYVQIIQTPWIIAAATAGSFYTVPYKELGALNATASIDPDFNNTDGMSFAWYCRSIDDSEFQISDLANEPLVTVPGHYPDPDLGGCYGTGRGRLDSSSPILEIDTNVMIEDKSYTISLLISTNHEGFAVRQHLTNIYFYVAKGLPPGLVVGCFKNCEAKVNRGEKLILKSRCDIRCYGELAFTWTLYSFDNINSPEPYNLSMLNEFTSNQLTEMTSSPIDALEIAVKPNVLEPKTKYILAFRAYRPSGVFGELRYTLLTNEAPVNGTCSVSPLSGIAMETNFTVSCENWVDNESPLTVDFFYQIKDVRTTFFYRQIPSAGRVSATLLLAAGDEESDYRLNVSATVKDRLGGIVKQDFAVQVAPQPGGIELNQLQNLITGEGNALQDLFESGNSALAVGLTSNIASTLNTLEKNTTSNDSSSTQQSDSSKQIRAQLLTSLASANLSSKDTSSLEQMSAAVMALTNSDDLEPESQDASLQLTESLTTNLKELSDGDKGFSNILRGASNLVGGVGQMTKNIAKEASNISNENGASDQVKRSVNLVDNIQGVLLDNLVANEPPVNIESDELSMQVEKVMLQNLASNNNDVKGAKFGVPSVNALGIGSVVGNPNNTILQMQPVDIKMALVNKNPFSWDNTTSNTLTSNVVDIKMQSNMNVSTSNLTEDFSITIPRDITQFLEPDSFFLKPSQENTEEKTKEYLKYHRFERKSEFTSINFEMEPVDPGIQFQVYLKKETKPDIMKKDYDLSFELPDLSSCLSGNENVSNSSAAQSETGVNKTLYVDLRNCTRNPYTVFVSNVDIRGAGRYWFAVQHIQPLESSEDDDAMDGTGSRHRRSVSCVGEARRVRRSCVIIPPPPPKPTDPPRVAFFEVPDNLGFDGKYFFPNQTPNYNLSLFESSCLYWDEENETWTGEGCKVVLGTNKEQILCKCNHLTSFGSELLVAPNPIDFDSVFNNFGSLAENVAVLALISTILGVYIIGVIWARRADKKDDLMVGPTILAKPRGSYHYMITTYTGSRQNAGTTAKVVIKMSGDRGETCPVRLRDRHRPCFERQQENVFVVSFPMGIGDLSYLQIWHDNSGSSPSWYLSRVVVKDLQTEQMWVLFCENWLAVESEDGKVCRVLSIANEQEMTNFSHLFSARAIKGLADGHIWFSIVSRPATSTFTRVQRLSCALCLLCCTMITSAMFYNMGGQGPSPFAIHIGSLVIDLKPFVIGLQSSVIIVPVNVLIVQIFRNLRPKKEKQNSEEIREERNPNGVKIKDPNQEKPKGKLPYWFIYIAYAICYLSSAASIFFTLLYSIQWGKETSTEWVIAMVTSFLQSALLLQPIKVVLLAVVFAMCIRKPADSEEEANITLEKNQSDQEKTMPVVTQHPKKRTGKKAKKYLSPPSPAKLKKARIIRLKEIKMNAALKEIFAFFFFLICLMNVAQYHRDPNTYLLSKTLSETFVDVDSFSIPLYWVVDADSLWMWSRETLIPGLYGGEWYNGAKIQKGFLANTEDYLVGIPRVRLLRVEEDSCTVSSYFKNTIPYCNAQYSVANEDNEGYDVGWEPLGSTTIRKRRAALTPETEKSWLESVAGKEKAKSSGSASRDKRSVDPIQSGRNRRRKTRLLSSERPKNYTVQNNAVTSDGHVLSCLQRWRHQSTLELRGFPYWGLIALYSGGGYAANLGYDQITAYTVIADLHSNSWIDKQTRAVFVEFTVYNANTNLFGIMSIFIEFPSSSGVVTKVELQAARFYLHLDGGQTLAHVLVIFFMLYFLYREARLVHKQRWAYFKGFWNWVETILVISEFSLIILFLARLYEVDRNLLQLRENPKDYVGFQYAGQADALMTYILGVLVFFYILRFLRLLRFNKNFLVIGTTLSRITAPMLGFLIPFMSGYLAFGLFAFSVFGTELEDYSTFTRTMVTQFSMTLGDFDFEALVSVSLAFGSLYFFAFVGLNIMVLMNIFIAIINDSYADVQEDTAKIENEFELIDYVVGKLSEKMTRSTGYEAYDIRSSMNFRTKSKQRKKKRKTKRRVKKLGCKLVAINQCSAEVDLMCERLEELFHTIENGLEEDNKIEMRFHSVPEDKKDSYFKLLCFIESDPIEDCKSPTDIYAKYVELLYME